MKEATNETATRPAHPTQQVAVTPRRALTRDERGMVSAEWAVGIIAAIAIAGVLLAAITSGPVEQAILRFLLGVIRSFTGGPS